MEKPLIIDYYTDILCVWAWIAQRRIDELKQTLGKKIEFNVCYLDIFGDVATKMNTQWSSKGGYAGFAGHVQNSASGFEDAPVNSRIWGEIRPRTSANAHLVLKAVEIVHDKALACDTALLLRKAFFLDARDIGDLNVLRTLVEATDIDLEKIDTSLGDGSAMAALMHDYQLARQHGIKGSPSYVVDGGRQTLYGNVGYRVLLANIQELLKNPGDEASWC